MKSRFYMTTIKTGAGGTARCIRAFGYGLDIIRPRKGVMILQYGKLKTKEVSFVAKVAKNCAPKDYPKFLLSHQWKKKRVVKDYIFGKTTRPVNLVRNNRNANTNIPRRDAKLRGTTLQLVRGGLGKSDK